MSTPEQHGPDATEGRAVDPQTDIDVIDALLAAHGGDHRAAMKELLLDADFLRDQLYTASCMMSQGLSRGWRPKYERG